MTADDALTAEVRRDLEAIDAALAGRPVAPELTELGALALELRDGRPEIRPVFARDLDARAATGFPRRRRLAALGGRLPAPSRLLVSTALAGVLAVGVSVALVASDGGDGFRGAVGGGGAGGATTSDSEQESFARDAGDSAGTTSEPGIPSLAPGVPVPRTGGSPRSDGRSRRIVERSAAVVLAAAPGQVDEAASRIVAVADRLGGFVLSSSVTAMGGEEGASASGGEFLLRIPSARLPEALAQLSRIGDIRERRQTADDITREGVSARDRLAGARAERRSLLRRLAAAATDSETVRLRSRLRAVLRRVAAARRAVASVGNRARYATVAVSLLGDGRRTGSSDEDGGAWGPADAVRDALRVLEVAAGVLLVAAAAAIPLGLLIALGLAIGRMVARRGRERVLDAV